MQFEAQDEVDSDLSSLPKVKEKREVKRATVYNEISSIHSNEQA
jgi:hypothetical protein